MTLWFGLWRGDERLVSVVLGKLNDFFRKKNKAQLLSVSHRDP